MSTQTGPKSTSFRVWLATFIPGVAATVTAFVQNTGGVKTTALGIAGASAALLATLGKLFHDSKVTPATIAAGVHDVEAAFPGITAAASKVLSFAETDIPGVKGLVADAQSHISAVEAHVKEVEAKIPDLSGLEQTIRTVVADVFSKLLPTAPGGALVNVQATPAAIDGVVTA